MTPSRPSPGSALVQLSTVELEALERALEHVLESPYDSGEARVKDGDQAPLVRARSKFQKARESGVAKHPSAPRNPFTR